jgi:hypothetical protein
LWIRLIFREFCHLALEHTMSDADPRQLRVAYKTAVDDWVDTIGTLGRIARLIFIPWCLWELACFTAYVVDAEK